MTQSQFRLPAARSAFLVFLLLILVIPVRAQEEEQRPRDLQDLGKMLLEFIDTISVRGLDPLYLGLPEKPWQLIIKSSVNHSQFRLNSTFDAALIESGTKGMADYETRFTSQPSINVGLWGGYRGYGLGYTLNVSRDKNYLLTLGLTGGSYGLNIRLHSVRESHSEIFYSLTESGEEELQGELTFSEPVHSKNLIVDGYYAFNGKRFSYCAAYDQSVVQLRSAGSLLVGGMYYSSDISYDDNRNANFLLLMNDIGRVKQWQVSIGAGYAYNYVPAKGFLISALAMPMVSVLNRIKATRYGSNLHDYVYDPENNSLPEPDNYNIWFLEERSETGKISLNIDARLSLNYLWDNYFVNIYGQYYNVRYRNGINGGNHAEWSINASLGIRL